MMEILNYLYLFLAFTKPPYEIHESGWGEFELMIRVFFRENSKNPIDIFHQLKVNKL